MTGSICEHVTDVDSAKIFAAIELSKASWLVALHLPSHDKISVFQVPGGDVDRLLAILECARETAKARSVLPTVEIHLAASSRRPRYPSSAIFTRIAGGKVDRSCSDWSTHSNAST